MGAPAPAYGDAALSAFELDFLERGCRRRQPLGQSWSTPFETVEPVRDFRWAKRVESFAGWYYCATAGDHVGYESWLERDHLILLYRDPQVVGIASQPFWLHWHDGGRRRQHAPDHFVRLADGRGRVVHVRAGDRERLEHAAARPVIVPETIVCDHSKVFISRNFKPSCRFLEIESWRSTSCLPTRARRSRRGTSSGCSARWPRCSPSSCPPTSTAAPNTAAGTSTRAGHGPCSSSRPCWTSGSSRSGRTGRTTGCAIQFAPNEKYAALVEACCYVSVALDGDDSTELLPAEWRAVNDYGIKIKNRTYNSADLGPMRRRHSGVTASATPSR